MKLAVAESFVSIQGEGMTSGVPAVFLRLAGCNLRCGGPGTEFDKELHNGATWRCDTMEVWMNGTMTEFNDIFTGAALDALGKGAHLVITGGEPLMHQEKILQMLQHFTQVFGYCPYTEIETNGTIMPSKEMLEWIDQWNCSPKLSNSGNDKGIRLVPQVLTAIAQEGKKAQFKFVVSREEDVQEIKEDFIAPRYIKPGQVWVMPAAENREELALNGAVVSAIALGECWNFTTRLQIVLWDMTTGV